MSQNTHALLVAIYGESALSYAVKRSARKCQCGRESLQDDSSSGRPSPIITQVNTETVHQIALNITKTRLFKYNVYWKFYNKKKKKKKENIIR